MHARTSHHVRHLVRSRLTATAAALVMAGGTLLTTSGPASAASLRSDVVRTTATFTTLHGVAHNGGGDVIRGRLICASLHLTLSHRPVAILGHAATRVHGGFILRIRHTAALATYASKHHGFLNLDLEVYAAGQLATNRVTFPYSHADAYIGTRPLKRTGTWQGKVGKDGKVVPDQYPPEFGGSDVSHPQIQWFEASGDLQVRHALSTSRSGTLEVGAGTSVGNWSIGGSITTSGEVIQGASGVLAGPTSRARYFTNALRSNNYRKCVHTAYLYHKFVRPGPVKCTYETVTRWLPPPPSYRPHVGDFHSCTTAKHFDWVHRTAGWNDTVFKHTGKSLKSTVYVHAFSANVTASVSYSAGATQTYEFDLPNVAGSWYCLGGTNAHWNFASRVFTSTMTHRPSGVLHR